MERSAGWDGLAAAEVADAGAGIIRAGRLILAGAPIGTPADAPSRLAGALAQAPVVAAEDTRRIRRLASALGVTLSGRLVSYWDVVESGRAEQILAELRAGRDVLLISDAGMPGVSDPGYRLVAAAAAAGLPVTVLPGPSAVTAALAVSGLPSDRFCFEGFPPRKAGEAARRFAELATEPRTMIFFESRRRLAATLTALATAFGAGRRAVVCRELTKTHEEIRRGTLAELTAWAAGQPLGEITIVVEGARRPARGPAGPAELAGAVAEVERQVGTGTRRNAAISAVAREHGLVKRDLYDAVVAHRSAPPRAGGNPSGPPEPPV